MSAEEIRSLIIKVQKDIDENSLLLQEMKKNAPHCPYCKAEWGCMKVDDKNPDCFKSINCGSCGSIWELVT